jgi:MerR family copper efflux transcriptional regulator
MELTVGKLAKESGVNLQTIRYYERRKLIASPKRNSSGYRQFPADAVQRILFIKHAQGLGFSLREIQELLNLRLSHSVSTCADVRRTAERKIEEIENKIHSLTRMKRALSKLAAQCSEKKKRTNKNDCPLLEALEH